MDGIQPVSEKCDVAAKDGNNTLDTPNKDRPSGDRVNPDWLLNPNSDTADWTLRSDLPQTDWVDAILQTAFTHSHQVSVSSKGDRYSIYASAGYLNQEGIVKHTGYERFNFRINASMNINKHIKAGVNFAPTILHRTEVSLRVRIKLS